MMNLKLSYQNMIALALSFLFVTATAPAVAQSIQPILLPANLSKFIFVGSSFNPEKLRTCEKFRDAEFWKKVMGQSNEGPSGPCYVLENETLDASGALLKSGTIYGLKELAFGTVELVTRDGQVRELKHSNIAFNVLSYGNPQFREGDIRAGAMVLATKTRLQQTLGQGRETNGGMQIYWWYDPNSKIRYSLSSTSGIHIATAELLD